MDTVINETKVAVVPAPGPEQEQALTREVTSIEMQAEAFIVETDEDYQLACDFGRTLKQKMAEVTAFFKPMKDSAFQAHRAICDREKAMLKPLNNAERTIKASVSGYLKEQERKRAEIEAAAKRAAEAERERLMKEAEVAEHAGNAEAAEAALTEAVIMDSAKDVAISVPQKPKAAGTTATKDWEIEIVDAKLVPIEVSGAVIRPVDEKAILRLVRATKGAIKIPGVKVKETMRIGFRR